MGNCGATERNRIKYIPGYEEKTYGVLSKDHRKRKRFRHWGITLEMIEEFIEECGGRDKLEGLSTREVCDGFLIPLTKDKHKVHDNQYVTAGLDRPLAFKRLGSGSNAKGGKTGAGYVAWKRTLLHPGVTDADIWLCHSWDDNFLDMVTALNFHLGAEKATARIWIDLFCNNQHKADRDHIHNHRTKWLTTTMKEAIKEMERFVVILGNWESPRLFSRAWPLMEMYYAIEQNRSLEIVLRTEDIADFRQAIAEESPMTIPYTYFRMLGQVDFRSAQTTHRFQHRLILKALKEEASKDNITPVLRANQVIMTFFKNWVIRESTFTIMDAKGADDHGEAETKARESMANIFRFDGRPDVSTEVYHEALEWRLQKDPECLKADTVRTMYLVANSHSLNRQAQKAAELYEKVLQCQMAPLEEVNNDINQAGPEDMVFIRKLLSHPDTLLTIRNLCGELFSADRIDDMFYIFNDVYDKYRNFLGTSYVVEYDDGTEQDKVAREHIYVFDPDQDLTHGAEVEVVQPHHGSMKKGKIKKIDIATSYPLVVQVGNCLGFMHFQTQAWDYAEPFILDALEVRMKHLGPEFSDTLVAQRTYAKLLEEQDDLREADEVLEQHWRATVARWRRLEVPNLVSKLELHEAAYLYASFLLRHGDAEVARQKFDLERYAMDAGRLLGFLHPDATKMRDLYVDVLRHSQARDRHTKSSEFLVEYEKLRWDHRETKIIILADKGSHSNSSKVGASMKEHAVSMDATVVRTPKDHKWRTGHTPRVNAKRSEAFKFMPLQTVKERPGENTRPPGRAAGARDE